MFKKIDTAVFQWFQSIHSDWLTYFFRDITSFGGPTVTTLVFLFSSIILALLNQTHLLIINVITFIITTTAITVLKIWFDKPRPLPYDPDIHGFPMAFTQIAVPHFPSCPSGHTTMSMVLYNMLGLSMAHQFPQLYTFLVGFGLTFPIVIAISRLYLGAHWLTDVIAGYFLGLLIIHIWMMLI